MKITNHPVVLHYLIFCGSRMLVRGSGKGFMLKYGLPQVDSSFPMGTHPTQLNNDNPFRTGVPLCSE